MQRGELEEDATVLLRTPLLLKGLAAVRHHVDFSARARLRGAVLHVPMPKARPIWPGQPAFPARLAEDGRSLRLLWA